MKKVVLYLEETPVELDNLDDESVEWVDEETEMSLVSSHFCDKNHDEYPSTGRMYVRTNEGNFTVRRIIDLDWDEACKVMEEERKLIHDIRMKKDKECEGLIQRIVNEYNQE